MTASMAPVGRVPQDKLEKELKDIVQNLYELMVQAAAYDQVGSGIRSRDVLVSTITHLHSSLTALSTSASSLLTPAEDSSTYPASETPQSGPNDILIPPELLTYVDGGRNPDIYTREFVELARRGNQIMKGKQEAFGSFRDVLAREMSRGLPELKDDVKMVVEATGGNWDDVKEEEVEGKAEK